MLLTERVAHNIGVLRRGLTVHASAFSCSRQCGECRDVAASSLDQAIQTLTSKTLPPLLVDEEQAVVEYTQLAANPVLAPFREVILGLAKDEQRHYGVLKNILDTLRGVGHG